MRRTIARLALVLLAACGASPPEPVSGGEATPSVPGEISPIAEPTPAPASPAPSSTATPACEATSPRPARVAIVVTPDDGDTRVIAMLDDAKTSADVTIYQLSSRRVIAALKAAAARGVRVRIIQDRREASPERVADLRAAGIDVHTSSESFRFTHQKTITIDGRLTFVFSGNLDRLSFGSGRNYGVVDEDTDDVADFEELFEADWAERLPDLACTRLVVAPINARARVLALLAGATTSLDVEAMYVTDAEVEEAIAAAFRRGVAVRVLFNDPAHDVGDTTESAIRLAALGVPVRRSGPFFIHAKLLLADGTRAFVGSENFSENSLDRNREAGVVVSTVDADVARIADTFAADWAAALPF